MVSLKSLRVGINFNFFVMKKYFKFLPFLLLGLCLVLNSCSPDEEISSIDENTNAKSVELESSIDYEIEMLNFTKKFIPIKSEISQNKELYNAGLIDAETYEQNVVSYLSPFYKESENLLHAYGLNSKDFDDIGFSVMEAEKRKYVKIIMALTAYAIHAGGEIPISVNPGMSLNSDPWSSSRIGPCILEALGAEALVDLWKGRAMSSIAARRAIIKGIGKVAARIGLGAIGTAIAVADFAWCMGRD